MVKSHQDILTTYTIVWKMFLVSHSYNVTFKEIKSNKLDAFLTLEKVIFVVNYDFSLGMGKD